jgi:hypothetical protein
VNRRLRRKIARERSTRWSDFYRSDYEDALKLYESYYHPKSYHSNHIATDYNPKYVAFNNIGGSYSNQSLHDMHHKMLSKMGQKNSPLGERQELHKHIDSFIHEHRTPQNEYIKLTTHRKDTKAGYYIDIIIGKTNYEDFISDERIEFFLTKPYPKREWDDYVNIVINAKLLEYRKKQEMPKFTAATNRYVQWTDHTTYDQTHYNVQTAYKWVTDNTRPYVEVDFGGGINTSSSKEETPEQWLNRRIEEVTVLL